MPVRWTTVAAALAVVVALACDDGPSAEPGDTPTPAVVAAVSTPTPAATPTSMPTPMPHPTLAPQPTPESTSTPPTVAAPTSTPVTDREGQKLPISLTFGWKTDFGKHSVPYSEIIRGGPPRDGIPPIDDPNFIAVSDAPDHLVDHEPVVTLEFNGEAKAYPVSILMWHEIVNDEVGGLPVSVTYCPLCNTAIVFDRRVGDRGCYDFGTSGNLRNSDLHNVGPADRVLVAADYGRSHCWRVDGYQADVPARKHDLLGRLQRGIPRWTCTDEGYRIRSRLRQASLHRLRLADR